MLEQLIQQGHSILFTTCNLLVQQLLIAKRDLRLSKLINQLSSFEGLIIDDLGYVSQTVAGTDSTETGIVSTKKWSGLIEPKPSP